MFCTFISVATGNLTEGVIVSRGPEQMRVVAPGLSDTLELRGCGTDWVTETGEKIQLEFMAADCGVSAPSLLTRAAGCAALNGSGTEW